MKVTDHFLSKENFSILPSKTKGILETQPKPIDLSPYYQSDKYISHQDHPSTLFSKAYALLRKGNINYKLKLIKQHSTGSRILDYGCGVGDFIQEAEKKGFITFGYEPNDQAEKIARKNKTKTLLNNIKEKQYDIITLWHVLEHVSDYEKTIRTLLLQLNKNGLLVLALPNFNSFDAKYYKEHWAAYDVPRHLWHFSPKGVSALCEKLDLEIIQKKPLLLDAFYVSLLSEKYKGNPLGLLIAPVIGLISNLLAFRTGNYSSIIYLISKKQS